MKVVSLTDPSWIKSKVPLNMWKVHIIWDCFRPIFPSRGWLWLIICGFSELRVADRSLLFPRVVPQECPMYASIFLSSCLLLKLLSLGILIFLIHIHSELLALQKEKLSNIHAHKIHYCSSCSSSVQEWRLIHHYLLRKVCNHKLKEPTPRSLLNPSGASDMQFKSSY